MLCDRQRDPPHTPLLQIGVRSGINMNRDQEENAVETSRPGSSQPEVDDPDTPVLSPTVMGLMQPCPREKIKPRVYDGTVTWREYAGQFDRISRLNGWTNAQKLDLLWVHLAGEALTYVESLTLEQTATYDRLVHALEERFGDQHLAEVYKSELRGRHRQKGESLLALAQDVRKLVQKAYPDIGRPGLEELVIEKFREALPDHDQRKAAYQSKARTLDQAVKAALDMESWQVSEARRSAPTHRLRAAVEREEDEEDNVSARAVRTSPHSQGADLIATLNTMMETFLAKVASQEPAQTTEKLPGPRCFYCQRPGHFQRDCRKRKAEDRKKSQSGKRARAALGAHSAAEEDGRATSPAVGKPHYCNSIGPLGTRSLFQECCGQGRGAGCMGCIAPCQAQGQLGSNPGCCPSGNGHSGCLLHKALPGCCPWREVVMTIFGATGSCGELCPGFRDLLGRLLLARGGTNGVGLASHPLGGCLGSHSTTGGDGGWAADGSDRASSVHERQCTPPGDLFSESPQKAVPVTRGCEARSSRTTSRIASPSRPGLPRHPTTGGEVPISGTKGPLPSVPSGSSTDSSSARRPSLPRRTMKEQAELGAREIRDNLCSECYDVRMCSHIEEIVPSEGVTTRIQGSGAVGRCNAPTGDLSESPQKAASTGWRTHSAGVSVTSEDARDLDSTDCIHDHSGQESNVGSSGTEVIGRVLRSDKDDVEVEVVGRVQSLLGEQHSPEVRWLVDTGATRSILSANTYRRVLSHIPLRPIHAPMTAINGSRVPVLGACTLVVILNGKRYEHDFIVAGIEDEGVLGRDFLRANRCQWNWEHNVLEVDGQEIRCRVPLLNDIPTEDVRAVRTCVIPARTEMVIEGQLGEGTRTLATGMLTGLPKFMERRQLGVAATLARRRGRVVPVRVLNPSSRKRTVVIGDAIASYQAVEVLEHQESMKGRAVRTKEGPVPLTPELEDLYRRGTEELSDTDKGELRSLLGEYSDIFSSEGKPLGRTDLVKHSIHTGDHRAIRQPPRRAPLGQESVVQGELDKMLKQGVIEPSSSAWASPVVLVKKKDGSVRFCVDYRRLNDITEKDAYPLPRVADNLDALAGARLFSTLDLTSGYWQVEMDPDDAGKTAFCTRYRLYQWRVMPFGLCNAPSTFERLMEKVLAGLQWKIALLYLDDVIVFSSTVEQQLDRLRLVFERIRKANLQLKPKKCHLFCKEVSFLGHWVSAEGVTTEEDKVQAVKEWPVPKSVKAVRSFLGLTGYYRRFVKDYAAVASPLIALTQKAAVFKWGEEEQRAFETLKDKLVTAPILGYPDMKERFILDTDASKCAIGAVLSQVQNGKEVVIAYGSRRLTKSERNYCVTRQELLAIVWFTGHFKHYLIGKKFLLRTDHGSLRWLFRFKEPEGQMARWLERLARFEFDIEHRPGVKHVNSDGLSRIPCEGHCKSCLKGHEMAEKEETEEKTSGTVRAVRTANRRTRGRTERQRRQKAAAIVTPNEWMAEIRQWQEADPDLQVLETWHNGPVGER